MSLVSGGSIKSIVNVILKDVSITISATYKSVSSSYSTTTRNQTEVITTASIRALRSEYTLSEIKQAGGIIQQGDVKFTVRADILSDNSITPNRKDRINDGSRDWEIIDYNPVYVGSIALMYAFQCR